MDVVTLQLYALEPRQNHFGLRQIKFIIYSAWHFKSLLATDFMQVAVDFKHVLIFEKKKKNCEWNFYFICSETKLRFGIYWNFRHC